MNKCGRALLWNNKAVNNSLHDMKRLTSHIPRGTILLYTQKGPQLVTSILECASMQIISCWKNLKRDENILILPSNRTIYFFLTFQYTLFHPHNSLTFFSLHCSSVSRRPYIGMCDVRHRSGPSVPYVLQNPLRIAAKHCRGCEYYPFSALFLLFASTRQAQNYDNEISVSVQRI